MTASAATTPIPVEGSPEPPPLLIERVLTRRRLTVAFRLLLALPQLILVYVLTLVGSLVLIVGWFAALFLGRLPEGIADFLSQIIRYAVRVVAYTLLLTDEYPPFQFSAEDYPVRVELAPGRLNRLAVLFRLFLLIPAQTVVTLALAGWFLASFFIWLLVLVLGRVPGGLFDATTALLRYSFRYNAYYWLVTAAYPWGLFGDRPGTAAPQPVAQQTQTAPAEAAAVEPTAEAALAEPTAELQYPGPARRLVLSAGAKRLVLLFLVLGVASQVATGIVSGTVAGGTVSRATALSDVVAAHDRLNDKGQKYQQDIAACSQELRCVQRADGELAAALETFATDVDRVDFPASARDEGAAMVRAGHEFAGGLRGLVAAPSAAEYTRLASGLDQVSNSFDRRYQELVNELTG
jgi:Domain of unknown function (DUF4389)